MTSNPARGITPGLPTNNGSFKATERTESGISLDATGSDPWCRDETCKHRNWRSGSMPTHRRGYDCPPAADRATTIGDWRRQQVKNLKAGAKVRFVDRVGMHPPRPGSSDEPHYEVIAIEPGPFGHKVTLEARNGAPEQALPTIRLEGWQEFETFRPDRTAAAFEAFDEARETALRDFGMFGIETERRIDEVKDAIDDLRMAQRARSRWPEAHFVEVAFNGDEDFHSALLSPQDIDGNPAGEPEDSHYCPDRLRGDVDGRLTFRLDIDHTLTSDIATQAEKAQRAIFDDLLAKHPDWKSA